MSKILLFFSITLLVAGIVAGLLTGQWSLSVIVLLGLGIALSIATLAVKIKKNSHFWQQRNLEVTVNNLLSTLALLIILGLVNFLTIRHPIRLDLTENQIFTLSPQAQEIALNLKKPLKVWIFDRNIDPETQTLLKNYRRYGNNFSYQLIDPNLEINLAERFSATSLGDVYLVYGEQRQKLETTATSLGTNITEAKLTNAIAKIQQDRTPHVYFLQGHGESTLDNTEEGLSQAVTELTEKGYVVATLNLATQPTIPDDADVIAIVKPLRRLLDTEVTSLQQYLENGGNLLLMLMPNIDIGLEPILQEWGIQLDNRLVIDGSASGERPPTIAIVDRYGNHPITEDFNGGITLFPQSRVIKTTAKPDLTATPLVITNENTWAESNLASEEITFNSQEDLASPLNIAIAFTKENTSRMVVFGNAIFATNGWFTQQLNGDLFLNTIDWLAGVNKDILSISPKELVNRRINLSPLQATAISWLAMRIMPLFSFLIAGIIWWRKR